MILALDIGNTNVVLGCIADGKILFTERMATDSGKTELDYAISLKMVLELREIKVSEITGAIIGSVVPPVTSLMREAIRKVTGQEALVVNVDMNIGLEVLMDNPSSVGTDPDRRCRRGNQPVSGAAHSDRYGNGNHHLRGE